MAETCSGCGAAVVWALTPSGGKSPLDREPAETGNVMLIRVDHIGLMAITLSKEGLQLARDHGLPLRLSHFATCPEREQFQRTRA